jgi:hypothetical protein
MRFAVRERAAQVPGYAYEGTIGNGDIVPLPGDLLEIDGSYRFVVESRSFGYAEHGEATLTLHVTALPPANG